MKVDDEDLSLGIVGSTARVGWAEAAKSLAEVGGDELVMGEFGNAEDSELTW
jgi:antitoxin MazE